MYYNLFSAQAKSEDKNSLVKETKMCGSATVLEVSGQEHICVCRGGSPCECGSGLCFLSHAERAVTLKPQAVGCSTSGRKKKLSDAALLSTSSNLTYCRAGGRQ